MPIRFATTHKTSKTICTIARTNWGYLPILTIDGIITRLFLPDPNLNQIHTLVNNHYTKYNRNDSAYPDITQSLIEYFQNGSLNINCTIDISYCTPFAAKILRACCNIPTGETISYKQLSINAGSPNAARAVGNVMASNHIPLIIPCHRVISSGNKPGGYSGSGGVKTKLKLLELEQK